MPHPSYRDQIDPAIVAELAEPLRALMEAELAAGNEIVETSRGWPKPDTRFVMLRKPFLVKVDPLPPGVRYDELHDPHWWHSEYGFGDDLLACRFA